MESSSEAILDIKDAECPVCFEIMVEPVKALCHYLCLKCIRHCMLLLGICPLCRTTIPKTFKPSIDAVMRDRIEASFKEEFDIQEEKIRIIREEEKNALSFKFLFGNDHEILDTESSNKHKWTVYVRAGSDNNLEFDALKCIKKVLFELHPTFANNKIERRHPPFESRHIGWGTFMIPITIFFQDCLEIDSIRLKHYLSFSGRGDHNVHEIKIPRSKLDKIAS